MKSEELKQRIHDLHAKAKATDFGTFLINSEKLEGHLAEQNDQTLEAIARFYEGLLEESNS